MHKANLWNQTPKATRRDLIRALGGLGAGAATLALPFAPPVPAARAADAPAEGLELLMFVKEGCAWCRRWEAEIGPIYPLTPEGAAAPLRRLDIHDPLPGTVKLARTPVFTPTFVLLRDGGETGRIEGYAGEAFFWGLLEQLLAEAAA